jgi:hypothetical protein
MSDIEEIAWPTMNRANNLVTDFFTPSIRAKGNIHCHRKRSNVLLPNGDVVLCCNDYGMQHVLGNLLTDTYESLFRGKEFRKVVAGMKDDKSEILCRYCSERCMKIT